MRSPHDHRLGAEGTARGGAHGPGAARLPGRRRPPAHPRAPAGAPEDHRRPRAGRRSAPRVGSGGLARARGAGAGRRGVDRLRRWPLDERHVPQRRACPRPHPPQGRRPAALRQDARRVPRAGGHRGRHDVLPEETPSLPITATQHNVLIALCRPLRDNPYATPATNSQISSEMHLGVDAIKVHLRSLYRRLGIEALPAEREAGAAGGARDPSRSDQRARSSTASRPRGRTGRCRTRGRRRGRRSSACRSRTGTKRWSKTVPVERPGRAAGGRDPLHLHPPVAEDVGHLDVDPLVLDGVEAPAG